MPENQAVTPCARLRHLHADARCSMLRSFHAKFRPAMHAPPAISVILPCHNLAAHIGAAIASLRAQSFPWFEALVIDDGSTDDTRAAAQRAIADDARFRLISRPHRGLSAARNHGLDAARGVVVGFLDGDDLYERDFLRAHHDALTRFNAGWTASALTLFWPDGTSIAHSGIHGAPDPQGSPRWLPLMDACDIAALFPSAWNKLYRRDLIGTTRFRDGALYEDHPFFWELATRARHIRYLPQPLYRYRQGRAGQITAQADDRILQHLDRLREVAQILSETGLTRQREGLSRLATRAVDERCRKVSSPAQRARFVTAAAKLFAAQGWHWAPADASDIQRLPAPVLDPEMRLSVVLSGAAEACARNTRAALDAQTLPPVEIIALETHSLQARLEAAINAQGSWVALLRAGDRPHPDWARRAMELARSRRVSLVSLEEERDSGLAAKLGLVACDPAMTLIRRASLCALGLTRCEALSRLPEPVGMAVLCHLLCPDARHVPSLPHWLMTRAPRPTAGFCALARALCLSELGANERAAIFAHLAQTRLAATPDRARRYWLAASAGLARLRNGLAPPPETLRLGPSLRWSLGQRLLP